VCLFTVNIALTSDCLVSGRKLLYFHLILEVCYLSRIILLISIGYARYIFMKYRVSPMFMALRSNPAT
jgi:hypothetical protein